MRGDIEAPVQVTPRSSAVWQGRVRGGSASARRTLAALAAALGACVLSRAAAAQTATIGTASAPRDEAALACPAGEVAVAGHCCGPAQGWDAARGECASAPAPVPGLAWLTGRLAPVKYPRPRSTAVSFVAADPRDRYQVSVQSTNPSGTCATPCTMQLAPGYATLDVDGAGRFRAGVNIGYQALALRLDHRMMGRTLGYVFGTLTAAVGAGLAIGGLVALINGPDCSAISPGLDTLAFDRCTAARGTNTTWGIVGITAGLLVLPIGLGVLASAAGTHEVSVLPNNQMIARAPRGPRILGLGVSPEVGGASGTVRFAF